MLVKTVLAFVTIVASASNAIASPLHQGVEHAPARPQEAAAAATAEAVAQHAVELEARPTPTPIAMQEPTPMTTPVAEPRPQEAPIPAVMNRGYISGFFPGSFVSGVEGERHSVGFFEPTTNIMSPGRVYRAGQDIMAPERMINPRILSPGASHRGQRIDERGAFTDPRVHLTVVPAERRTAALEPWTIGGEESVVGMLGDQRIRMEEGRWARARRMRAMRLPWVLTGREIFPGRMITEVPGADWMEIHGM